MCGRDKKPKKGCSYTEGPERLSQIALVADWLSGRTHDREGSHLLSPAALPSVPRFHTAKAPAVIRRLQNHHHLSRGLLCLPRFINGYFPAVMLSFRSGSCKMITLLRPEGAKQIFSSPRGSPSVKVCVRSGSFICTQDLCAVIAVLLMNKK